MNFMDCNLCYGYDLIPAPCVTMDELCGELNRADVKGGLVYNTAADRGGIRIGNELLAKDLQKTDMPLYGVYSIVPTTTPELPPLSRLHQEMVDMKMAAFRINPKEHCYFTHPALLSDLFEFAQEYHVPVIFDTKRGVNEKEIFEYLTHFPKLTAIVAYYNCWPSDRILRPFLEYFENAYIDLSLMLSDQGIEGLVEKYGARRLLFGSRFPECYLGGQMMNIAHADISAEDKALIAGGNLERLIREAMA